MYHDTDREERSSMIEMTEAENDSLGEMTEAEYGVLGEAAEAEYGICDLLDENIPSPLETDNAGETLVLPEIQDMTEYIRRHYEQEIMKKLAWRLRWEELCVVSDGRHYQDLPWTGSGDYGEEVSLEVRYEDGVYLLLKKMQGVWYITDVFVTEATVAYEPMFFWKQIKRGASFILAHVLTGWRALTQRMVTGV